MELNVSNISKRYGKNIVLKEFSYKFNSGLTLLTGKNGSGKSTLMKILGGLIKPTNKNYFISPLKSIYMCERIELGNNKSLDFLLKIKSINKNKDILINEVMDEWKIPNKYIFTLSKGNKQKCAIVMMMLTEKDIYLFDEPTDALDKASVDLLLKFIKDLIDRDKIVIIATHEKERFDGFIYDEVVF